MSSNIDRNMTPTADATNQPTASGAGDLVAGGLVGSDRVHGSVKGNKKRIPQRRRVPKLTGSCWYTIEIAAAKLDLDAQALQPEKINDPDDPTVSAYLADGSVIASSHMTSMGGYACSNDCNIALHGVRFFLR